MSIRLENVKYVYDQGTTSESVALDGINLNIEKGEFVAIIGHTGSGKSTLIQHLNGLEKPTSGNVFFEEEDVWSKDFPLDKLRAKVGLVFQYPEHQLFEATVIDDVCFGPCNHGLTKEEAEIKAMETLQLVGIKEDNYKKSPFELSGGQKRRVAIAGVLAMEPDFLILDEPTAGLDPRGRDRILGIIKELHEKKGMGVILVSHSMDDVAKIADRIVVMNKGQVVYDDKPSEVFKNYKELEKIGLKAPQVTYIMHQLKEDGFDVDEDILNIEDAKNSILKSLGK